MGRRPRPSSRRPRTTSSMAAPLSCVRCPSTRQVRGSGSSTSDNLRALPTDSILGTRIPRLEDSRLLTKGGVYTADLRDPLLDGALYATYVRSTLAHGTFTVDVSDALQADGVVGAFTG